MVENRARKHNEVNARELKVRFSAPVISALADLAAAVHFSDHFDGGIYSIVQDWAAGKPTSVHDVFISIPAIASETMAHLNKTGDKRAEKAWNELDGQLSERGGFTITKERVRGK
jgi:hypothetical protein